MPKAMRIRVATNSSALIKENVSGLSLAVIVSIVFAGIVVLVLLGEKLVTLVVAISIPVSLAFAMIVVYVTGHTLNVITLLAFLLLVGVAVDDSIIVVEKLQSIRDAEPDLPVKTVCLQGIRAISLSVLTATLTIAMLGLLSFFLKGTMGEFFKSFTLVLVTGVLASYLVSITLVPVLYIKFMSMKSRKSKFFAAVSHVVSVMNDAYIASLKFLLRYRFIAPYRGRYIIRL